MCTSSQMAEHDAADEEQTQPGARFLLVPVGSPVRILVEHVLAAFEGDARPLVDHLDRRPAVLDTGVHVDRGVLRRELRRVVHQLADDLDDPLPVEEDLLFRQIQFERMLAHVRGGDALTDRRREPLRPDVVVDGGRVDLQRRGRLRHRGEQSPGFLFDEPQQLASLVVVQAVVVRERGAGQAADGAHGPPDLVGDHGGDLGPSSHDLLRTVGGAPGAVASKRCGARNAKSAKTATATIAPSAGTTIGR